MPTAWIVAGLMVALAGITVRFLPAMHPGQLWAVPWALITILFAAHLLPYNDLRPDAAALIVGGSLGFVGMAYLSGRTRPTVARTLSGEMSDQVWWAALGVTSVTVLGADYRAGAPNIL